MKKTLFIISLLITSLLSHAQSDSTGIMVGLKNRTTKYPASIKYKTPAFGTSYLLLNKEEKLPIDQVKYYQDESGYYIFERVGTTGNQVRLKREVAGRVSTYFRVVSYYSPNMVGTTGPVGGTFSSSKLEYFQKGNGSLRSINYENLRSALSDNVESMAKLDRVRSIRKLNTLSLVGGAAMLIGGLIHMGSLNATEGPPPHDTTIKFSPLFFIGGAAMAIPLFTSGTKRENIRQAIVVYNQ